MNDADRQLQYGIYYYPDACTAPQGVLSLQQQPQKRLTIRKKKITCPAYMTLDN